MGFRDTAYGAVVVVEVGGDVEVASPLLVVDRKDVADEAPGLMHEVVAEVHAIADAGEVATR
jgi:hypothetical protein